MDYGVAFCAFESSDAQTAVKTMDVKNKKVIVAGLGRTAVALCRLVVKAGANPFVSEIASGQSFEPFQEQLRSLGVPFECGKHSVEIFESADLIIPSPGVSPRIEPIQAARRCGVPVISEMEFAFSFCGSKILAVTGTNGKTTTTELLKRLVEHCGQSVVLAGNNDTPFSLAVMIEPAPTYLVLEVSSYQLELAQHFRPWIGCVLNVTPDHLTRHGSISEYANVKAKIFQNQGEGDVAVLNADDDWTRDMKVPPDVEVRRFSLATPQQRGLWIRGSAICEGEDEIACVQDTSLPGRHNLQNVLAALTMVRAANLPWQTILEGLRSFRGVEHRIEYVTTINGVPYYNDSKSTNIDSLRVALESFSSPIVLLAGGRGKGADYRVLRDLVRRRVKSLVVFGEDAPLLQEAFADLVGCVSASTLEDAVAKAAAQASPGDIVLLSPACASFDMFQNFEHRGRVFKECVRQLERGLIP
ncbi:MAG TPA: UDP-N-acetylmuramoyl-L-alanine--D-glutamate ligase [Candidatus Hydrogenedentes bacterium]|nr:UDP-N-acetylmuramoyl-L-alanine--D-glutamate ligase [Candidatus Hydrogenedentota bacterium]HOL76008.1 UDP-N-acetylmuramoyl-L-alanine--D-glutamate ligase [Candidatus Hydrogenedentota bacterium]